MQRRNFLKAGAGIAVAGVIPLKELFAGPVGHADAKAQDNKPSSDELTRITQKYGSEFGQIKPETKEG